MRFQRFQVGIAFWLFSALSLSCVQHPIQGTDLRTGKLIEVGIGKRGFSKKGAVVVFLSANCPCSRSHEPVIEKLSQEFPEFDFLAVHANQDEPLEEAKAYFKTAQLTVPVIRDTGAQLANELKALKTPHAYVIGPQGQCWFEGGVDDTRNAQKAKEHYLRNALTAVRAGKEPAEKNVRTLGCVISRSGEVK
ncbi:thioredoxin family protein [bacterium]|nr:thioredoxin family protein [bacterium]NBW99185.1 thioredoxin family protein [bacterium]